MKEKIDELIKKNKVSIINNVVAMNVTDYDLFNILNCNRDINKSHVERIKRLIERNGFLISSFVLVDEFFNILDGQHRFEAQKKLGLPIRTLMIKGLTSKHMKLLNTASKNWSYADAVKYYASLGDKNYITLNKILKDYKSLGVTVVLNLLFDRRHDIYQDVQDGLIIVNDAIIERFNNRIKNYEKILMYADRFDARIGSDAVIKLIRLLDNNTMCRFLIRELRNNPNLTIPIYKKTANEIYESVDALLD